MPKSTFFPHHSLSPFISVFSHTHSLLLPLFCFLSRSPTTTIYSLRREPHPTPTLSSLRCDPPHSPSSPSFSSTTCRDRFSAQQPKSVFFFFCLILISFLLGSVLHLLSSLSLQFFVFCFPRVRDEKYYFIEKQCGC